MTHCRCHCRGCGSHFTSLEAFDAHHQGSGASLVPCVFPEDAPLLAITGGTCRVDDPERVLTGITVYTTERAQGAARYFGGSEGPSEAAGRTQTGGPGVIARRPEKPVRPVQDRTPSNILRRPLRLEPMRQIKNQAGEEGMDRAGCSCRRPLTFLHTDGRVTCVRCSGLVEEAGE